jgi:group I intron endonuclease
MYGYTYRTTCRITGRVYIGQKRQEFDPGYVGSGKQIRHALAKYGRQHFEVEMLDTAENRIDLNKHEQRAIIEHRSLLGRQRVMNITPGGEGCGKGSEHPSFGRKASPRERENMSRRMSGSGNPMFGVRLVGDLNPMFGKPRLQSTKDKIAAANSKHKGKDHGNFGRVRSLEHSAAISRAKMGKSHRGSPHSEEAKKKMSLAVKARFAAGFKCSFTEETRNKISEGRKRYWRMKKGEVS